MKAIGMWLMAVAIRLAFTSGFHVVYQQSRLPDTCLSAISNRRNWMTWVSASIVSSFSLSNRANAEESTAVATVEMKEFVDPQGLFAIRVPKDFFTIRRTEKGDLPDSKSGKGRRGSSIFSAGNMAKAEIVAIERYVPANPIQIFFFGDHS